MSELHLSRSDKESLHSVLRRSLERAELRKRAHPDDQGADAEAKMLARAVADLGDELAGRG